MHTEEEYLNIFDFFRDIIIAKGCLRCGETIVLSTNNYVICTDEICKYRYNIFKNTFFQDLKVSYLTFF